MANFTSNPNNSFLQNLYSQLAQGAGDEWTLTKLDKYVPNAKASAENIASILNNPNMSNATKQAARGGLEGLTAKLTGVEDTFAANPLKTKVDLGNGVTGNSLKHTLGMVGQNIKAHPLQAAGLGALGVANIAGLTDDDKIGGQLVGTLGGGALAHFLPVSPVAKLAIGMGGGTLGSLFDKLRAKKELEQQDMYQEQSY